MKTIRQATIERGRVLADAFQDAGFETESLEPGDDTQDFVLYINYINKRWSPTSYTRHATLHLAPDGKIHVLHGLNNVRHVLERTGLKGFVGQHVKDDFPEVPPRALVSSTNTAAAERAVRSAAAARFGRRRKEVFFEHDQWWVRMWNRVDEHETWSVVDVGRGLGFERIE